MAKNLMQKDLLSTVNLRMNPEGFSGVYGCMIEFQSDEECNQLRYKQKFEYIGSKNQNKHLFRITRFDEIFINDKEPDSLLQNLAHDVSKTFYPLEIECSLTGNYKKVVNFSNVKKRWSKKKEQLLTTYTGDDAIAYIHKVTSVFDFEERFQKKLSSDYFLALYFKPIFQYYTAFLSFENTFSFPILGAIEPVNFKVSQAIDEKALQKNDYRVHINGTIEDERSLTDLEQKLEYANYISEEYEDKGTCEITYVLNNTTQIIEGIDSTFKLEFGRTRKIMVKMFLLD